MGQFILDQMVYKNSKQSTNNYHDNRKNTSSKKNEHWAWAGAN